MTTSKSDPALNVPPHSAPPPESIGADYRRESREDYALRRVPNHFRKSPFNIGMVLTGSVWSVFSFATGGTLALVYGIPTTLIALGIGFVLGALLAILITRLTAANGLDIDLLSRGLGFGFMGSAFSSLVYAITFLMYCGFEASFIASAIGTYFPDIPYWLLAVVISAGLIPLNWYGFRLNAVLQKITWPLFIVGIIALAWVIFTSYTPNVNLFTTEVTASSLVAAVAVCLPVLSIQALLVGDWSRFARKADVGKVQVIASSIAIGGVFLVEAPLGAFMAVYVNEANPGVYAVTSLGIWGVIWVVVTQVRIQNMNYYSASLALANFSARVLRFTPGRQFWIIVTGAVTLAAAMSGILNHLLSVLTFCGTVLLAWCGTLLAGIIAGPKMLGIDLTRIEYRRGYLRNWGWPALLGLAVGTGVGEYITLANVPDSALGPFLGQLSALLLGGIVYIIAAFALRGKWSLFGRPLELAWEDAADAPIAEGEKVAACTSCIGTFTRTDMMPCPTDGVTALCSVCASKNKACHDECRPLLFPSNAL